MLEPLAAHLPQATGTHPVGGAYAWLTSPAALDAKAVLPHVVTGRVAYVPGGDGHADGAGSRSSG